MIDYIQIENFKCWRNTGRVLLAPLTVFFGANSSGKSSIGQFLMMLKQSVESSDRKVVFFTGNDHSAVDVGLPSDMIYRRDLERSITFSYGWKLQQKDVFELVNVITKKKKRITGIDFCGVVGLESSNRRLQVEKLQYTLKDSSGSETGVELRRKDTSKVSRTAYELKSNNYDFKRVQGRAWDITSTVRFYGFPDEAVAYYQNADFLQEINLYHEKLFSTFFYLGPLRNRAKRIYTWPGSIPRDAGISGEEAINALLASRTENRRINLKPGGKLKSIEELVAEELKNMKLIADFRVSKISEDRQDYEVKVRTNGSDQFVDIPDVGVGVSQVLPVVTELFYAPPGSTIIIEQPELHLHPSAQAALADVMVDAIHARENVMGRNLQLIIESHSEHFLRRLQRRMAEGSLHQGELAAYFINNENGTKLEPLQIDEYGDILNWPKDFFGDIQDDIYQQAMAAYKKRKEKEA